MFVLFYKSQSSINVTIHACFFSPETFSGVQSTKWLGDFLSDILLRRSNGKYTRFVDYNETKPQVIYPDIGFKIDVFGKIGHRDINAIWFEFNGNTDKEVEIQLEDKEHACLRSIFSNAMGQKGDKIQTKKGLQRIFSIDIHQEIFDENDQTKKCKNYPNENFKSFQECDEAFIRKQLDVGGLKNLTPIWAAKT